MNMCSNSSSTSACGCGSGGGGGNGVTLWSSSLKKQQQQQQKRPRIPKRGPGVAELEKILREQDTTIDVTKNDRGNNEGFSISSSCLIPHYHSSSLKSHPPPQHPRPNSPPIGRIVVPSAPKFDHIVPPIPQTIASLYGNTNNTHSFGRNGSGGSGEQELFPMNFTSSKSKPNLNEVVDGSQSDSGNSPSRNLSSESNHGWSYSVTNQKRNNGFPPAPMMNQFHGSGSNQASSASLSIGLHNHLEPPSNQNSHYNYTSRSEDDHKMVGIKRPHTLDNSLIPPSNFQVLPSFSRYNRPQQSSTNERNGVTSYNPTNEGYRDAKWGSSLELSTKRLNSDNISSGHATFPPFVTPEVPPPPPPVQLFQSVISRGNGFPCHVIEDNKMENSCQHSESSEQVHKPFFNFLEVKSQEEETDATSGSNHGGREGGRGGIDLSLKL